MSFDKTLCVTAVCAVLTGLADTQPVRLAPMGRILVPDADVRLVPTAFYPGWISRTPYGGYRPEADGSRRWRISEKWQHSAANNGTNYIGRTRASLAADGSLDVTVSVEVAATNLEQIGSHLVASLPLGRYAGGKVMLDGAIEKGIPATYSKGRMGVFRQEATRLALFDKDGRETLALRFPQRTTCYLQDNREWKGDNNFSLRLAFPDKGQRKNLVRGDQFALAFNLKTPKPIAYEAGAYVIREGGDWVRVKAATEPTPGSALDFSQLGLHDAPAGKHGWLVVRDGHFEFEKLPGVKQRFYGVNFVSTANYPPVKDADRYVANLARIGYNAVRFHHHDGGLADAYGNLKPEMMERFDAMVDACIRHGVYMTTDLYVSRRVDWHAIGEDRPGRIEMNDFKVLVETHEGAYSNFLNYARNFLNHVNPHTGRRYADEPAMPLYSLINEGNDRKRLTVENERNFARRMTRWVREEMKSRILLTNMNNYAYPEEYDSVRADEYDYIDGHFYFDHPHFLEQRWRLPSELANKNPLMLEKHGLLWPLSYRKRIAKAMPFVITEYNFSGPGAYRSLGGIETGAMAAFEDLDGLWRFAWSHGSAGVYGPKAMTYFDMSGDPLSLAGERASLCLFLRGDLRPGDAKGFAVDRETGSLRVVTERTCGGFVEKGALRAGRLEADVLDAPATVWASSIDARPLAESKRILCCHLTDVQNSGITFADDSRKVLLDWGKMPHLMRKGRARVRLALGTGPWRVYALDAAGNRRGEVPSMAKDGVVSFEADVARDPSDATMFYELVRSLAAGADDLYSDFVNPPKKVRPWTYWFLQNTLTDRETITEEYADIAALGFGGMLVTDSRGYWVDDNHLLVPEATIRWGSEEWLDLFAHAVREAAKNGLKFTLNIAASGGHLRGDVDVGADSPKFLMCRNYLPGEAFETPSVPHYRDVAVFAVKTAEPAQKGEWNNAGDGYYSMSASTGKRADGGRDLKVRQALDVRELKSAAEGAALGAGWTIVRFGAGTLKGQEVDIDVLDRTAVERHLERVMGKLVARVPDLVGRDKTFAALYNVSWEGAMPTWSATFERDFAAHEGYALRPFLPVLAGFTLAAKPTDALMRDFRHARGVMMKDHLYGAVRDWAHRHGMDAYSESGGPWKRNPQTFGECDQLSFLAANDFPQGEFWPTHGKGTKWGGHANANGRFISKGIVSASHVYDTVLASVEAFTHMHHHWSVDPAFLKPLGDQAYADGINRLVWHTYTSSPRRYGVPGIEYFAGSHINRNVTWHKEFSAMVTYLGRCQSLLQAGRPVTDVAVLTGDRAYTDWGNSDKDGRKPNGRFRQLVSDEIPVRIPAGFAYDAVNDDALARNPNLLARYAVVHDARKSENRKGTVSVGTLQPDVETTSSYTWCHRRIGTTDAYFLAGEGKAELTFRAAAKSVEVWDPVTGRRSVAAAQKLSDGRTKVTLDLPIGGSCFVMFGCERFGRFEKVEGVERVERVEVKGPWTVSFAYHEGISAKPPAAVTMDSLVDFTTHDDLKHFSGTATYKTTFSYTPQPPQPSQPPQPLTLSLGSVPSGLAHVYVNGRDCGTVWCAPWEADISAAVRSGENELEIRYVNNWRNRLIGDCSLPEAERVTRSNLHYWNVPRQQSEPGNSWTIRPTVYSGYSSFDALQPSGLLGPVEIVR